TFGQSDLPVHRVRDLVLSAREKTLHCRRNLSPMKHLSLFMYGIRVWQLSKWNARQDDLYLDVMTEKTALTTCL
ncbi:MAG: hypothetical protein V4719_17015, partial [Planctomycetota bacterium]